MSLPTDYQNFIATSRYARWLDDEQRRETWEETVNRYVNYITHKEETMDTLRKSTSMWSSMKAELCNAITRLDVMPSMRALMTAGPALERDNTAGYNCSYLPVDDPKSFDEAMYILLCGTGVGFSVERQYISKLPEVPEHLYNSDTCIVVADTNLLQLRNFCQRI